LLGPAGIGKTFELRLLEELERDSGYDVRHVRLGEVASNPDRLIASLDLLVRDVTAGSAIYLDAIDEAMIPVATTGQILADWVRNRLEGARPLLRVSCRSAIWPKVVQTAIDHVYGDESRTLASLEPLIDSDVIRVAESEGVDGRLFSEHTVRSNVGLLARQPLTLRMLLRLFQAHGGLPTGRRDLFSRAVGLLANEREERRELGTVTDIDPAVLLECAERLACLAILSGREAVDLSDDPSPSSLGLLDLSMLPSAARPLDYRVLRALGQSGLCEGDGANRFRFIHRNIAEYLAGRRIGSLLPHQARSLLCSGLGWQAGVAGPLRETAAFAAIESQDLARWVADTDPEVIGLSDVANDDHRRIATLRLLDRFRKREMTDALIAWNQLPVAGLVYPGAEADLKPVLKERGDLCEDVLELAIELVETWKLSSLHADLVDLIFDPGVPLNTRVTAGYVIAKSGSRELRRRLHPLILGSPEDPEDELKGLALRCCWPEELTTAELLMALGPRHDKSIRGAYFGFLVALDHEGFSASDDRIRGLAWAKSVLGPGTGSDPTCRIARRIAHGALDEIHDATIAAALADVLWDAAVRHFDSPLQPISRDQFDPEEPSVLVLNLY
jgi:hypothetical protein